MKALIWKLSPALLSSLVLSTCLSTLALGQASAIGQPEQTPPDTPVVKSRPGLHSPGRDPERSRAAYDELNARPVPRYALYSFFFGDLVVSQRSAAEVKSRGKSDVYYLTLYSRQAGLSDEEGVVLNEAALDWKKQQDAIEAQIKSIKESRGAEPNPPSNLLTKSEFSNFGKMQVDNVELHIEELKSSLGDSSFNKLNTYVKARYQPSKAQAYPTPSGNHAVPTEPEGDRKPQ